MKRRWLPALPIKMLRHERSPGTKLELFELQGHCLTPWLDEGDVCAVDRGLEPRDGDLVLASVAYQADGPSPWGADVPWIQHHASVKQWRGGALACNEGTIPLEPYHKLLGVVVAVHRKPSLRWRSIKWPLKGMRFDVPDLESAG